MTDGTDKTPWETVYRKLLESGMRNGGTPSFKAVAEDVKGWNHDAIRKRWNRGAREELQPDAAKGRAGAKGHRPPPENDEEEATGDEDVRPETMEPEAFYAWRVHVLNRQIKKAERQGEFRALGVLEARLQEAHRLLVASRPEGETPENMPDEEYLNRMLIGLGDATDDVWEGLLHGYEKRVGRRLLIAVDDGGAAMLLGLNGWERTGPPVAWRDDLAVVRR